MSTGTFPLLKPREIFASLREMCVPVSEDEIRSCDPGAVRKVLEVFIESAMGVTREDMAQIAFPGLPTLSFPELHSESVPELTFYRTAQRLLAACGVNDFGLRDVLHPTPKRVRRQLSALINFAKFRQERLEVFGEITGQTDELLAQKKALQEENAALQRELDQLLEEQKEEEPERRQLQEEVSALEKDIDELNRQQAVYRIESDAKKAKCKDIRDAVSSVQYTNVQAKEKIEELNGLIVNSPDRVKGELTSIGSTLENARGELHQLQEKYAAVKDFIEIYERAEKELAETLSLLDEIKQEMEACRDAKNQVKDARKRVDNLKGRIKETATRRQRMEKIVELKKRELDRYIRDARAKDEATSKSLQAARNELSNLESVHYEVRQRIDQNKDASRKVELKMKEEEAQYQKDLKNMEQMYARLHQSAEYYSDQVLNVIRPSS